MEDMHIFGELKDRGLALEIIEELRKKGMNVVLDEDPLTGMYRLWLDDQSRLDEAFNYYRVRVGLPAPAVEIPEEWQKLKKVPMGQLTKILILFSVVITLFIYSDEKAMESLFFNRPGATPFESILSGEYWRLITPIFLHFGLIHIVFNMLWLKDLGSLFEDQFGPKFLLLFTLIVGILSNLGQYLHQGEKFGGMSGVVYGLLALLWVLPKLVPQFEYKLPKHDINLMIIWYVLCLTGVFGPIANMAHGLGASGGILTAVIVSVFFYKRFQASLVLIQCFLALVIPLMTWVVETYIRG